MLLQYFASIKKGIHYNWLITGNKKDFLFYSTTNIVSNSLLGKDLIIKRKMWQA